MIGMARVGARVSPERRLALRWSFGPLFNIPIVARRAALTWLCRGLLVLADKMVFVDRLADPLECREGLALRGQGLAVSAVNAAALRWCLDHRPVAR